jgi:hypothetical protein
VYIRQLTMSIGESRQLPNLIPYTRRSLYSQTREATQNANTDLILRNRGTAMLKPPRRQAQEPARQQRILMTTIGMSARGLIQLPQHHLSNISRVSSHLPYYTHSRLTGFKDPGIGNYSVRHTATDTVAWIDPSMGPSAPQRSVSLKAFATRNLDSSGTAMILSSIVGRSRIRMGLIREAIPDNT